MSEGEWTPRPYVVGEENVYVVGVQGVVEALSGDTITIAGSTLPRALGKGVRYVSMIWPEDEPCDREHCGSECDPEPADSDAREDLDVLTRAIRERHEEIHGDAMRFCSDSLCREAWELL